MRAKAAINCLSGDSMRYDGISEMQKGRTRGCLALVAGMLLFLLAAQEIRAASITLYWSAPGENGLIGRAVKYDLRYTKNPLTEATWNSATIVAGLAAPRTSGSAESFTISGLDSSASYYFGLKTADKFTNWSPLSNVAYKILGDTSTVDSLKVGLTSILFTTTEGKGGTSAVLLSIASSRGLPLTYSCTENSSWFSLTNPSGTTPGTVTVVADFSGRTRGIYLDSIRVTSPTVPNSPLWVRVTLEVLVNNLVVTPDSLNFSAVQGVPPLSKSFDVSEASGRTIDFSCTTTASWMILRNANGMTPASVTDSINILGLAPGTYRDSISVTSTSAANSPRWVKVALKVDSSTAPKRLVFSSDTMKFWRVAGDSTLKSQTFVVSEAGGRRIDYSCLSGARWITLGRPAGTTPDTVSVSITTIGLSPDSAYVDSVQVTSTGAVNSPRWVRVTISTEISTSTRNLVVTPDSLHFSAIEGFANPPTQSISVTEASSTVIPVSLSSTAKWIVLANPDATTPATMSVGVSTSGLVAGYYLDSVRAHSSAATNSPVWMPVSLDIQRPPDQLYVDSDSLVFTAAEGDTNPSPAQVVVAELHNRAISFTCAARSSWVILPHSSGTTPASVAVGINLIGLHSADYLDSIQVASSSAINSPRWVRVILHLGPPKRLTFSEFTITNVTATSATIGWRTSQPATSQVLYGVSELYGHSTAMTTSKDVTHTVVIADLNSSTLYHLQLVCDPGSGIQLSGDTTFVTTDILKASGSAQYNVSQPTLIVENIVLPPGSPNRTHSGNGANKYYFIVARDSTMSSVVVASPAVEEQTNAETAWKIPLPLEPNQHYYWRASVNNVIYTNVQSFVVTGDVHAYPNPYRPQELANVTFTGVPRGSNLLILTINGELIKRWTDNSGQDILWNGRNESGAPVASGTYLWYIESSDIKGKLIIIR